MTVEDGIVLKGTQIVVPHKKYDATLKLIHEGHLGLQKCKLNAKDTVYWPGLNNQLEKMILNYELYLMYSQAKHKCNPTKTLGQEIPVHPWFKLASDIFYFEGAAYLLIVDCTSRFLIVCRFTSMTGKHIKNQCKSVFSEYGWPNTLIFDNGPCYTLQEFMHVMQAFSVNHITSPPLPTIQWTCRKVCPDCEVLVQQGKSGRKRVPQVFNDLSQHPTYR